MSSINKKFARIEKENKADHLTANLIKKTIKEVQDFPVKGVLFRDFTPILADNKAFKKVIDSLYRVGKRFGFDTIVAPESRGFWFAIPLALRAKASFIPCRKPNKLPRKTIKESYTLEYGVNELSVHVGDIKPGAKVLIVDDLLATGGTIKSIIKLVKRSKATPVGVLALAELTFLKGRKIVEQENLPLFTFVKW